MPPLLYTAISALPLSFLAWGASYVFIIRRRGLSAPRHLIAAHFLLVTVILASLSATIAKDEYGVLALTAIVLSMLSCGLLAKFSPPASEHDALKAYNAGNRVAEFFRGKPRSLLLIGALGLVVAIYWLGYPWTYDQCLRWAARQPTEKGVLVALHRVCSSMEPSSR